MLILSTLLIAVGVVVALMGVKLFRLLLPIIGLVTGTMAGFIGIQAVFGTGIVATTVAIVMAVLVGVLLAVLSFAFFDLAIIIYIAMLGAALFAYLGVALGLQHDGFLVFLLGLAGAVLAAMWAARGTVSLQIVMAFTSFIGVAYVLAGLFLVFGNLSIDDLNQNGVAGSIVRVVDQSFLWMFVWLGASLVAWQLQARSLFDEFVTDTFEYKAVKK